MRSFRRDERGISPVVATILLIAATVIAGGVIAAFVSGLYVGGTRLPPVGTLSGNMYDSDSGAADTEYQDENVKLTFALTEGRIRDVGHASDGIKVVLDWPQYNWGPITIGPTKDRTNYSNGYSRDNGVITSVKTVGDENFGLRYELRIPCDAAGTFDKGSGSGIVKLWVVDNVGVCISGSTIKTPNFWNENQTYMGMEIQSADGAFTTSFGTVSVYPQTWG